MALILIASLFSSINAYAHGTVGDYTFLEPIVADDANPKNELDLLRPQWTRMAGCRVFSLGFSLEKVIAASTPELTSNGVANDGLVSLTLGDDWIYQSPRRGKSASGFNELELLPKWAFLTMPEHEFRLSLGMRIIIPAGSPSVEAQHHTQLGPEFLWVKGMGELGNDGLIKYLRPFAVQGDFGYVPALGGRTWHEMFADNVIEYSMPYLNNNVKDLGLGWPLRNLYPYIEFNYDQLVSGPPGQTFPQIAATPGIAFMNYYVELSIATQFALNHASVAGNHATVIGLLDLFIDDIFPPTNWTPL
ncbi:MAG: hypothetical protein IVW54_13335 [Candidatus Binataceae bacterium]|nr:hypothetical protein [Candidatus Binataceae bacterium]